MREFLVHYWRWLAGLMAVVYGVDRLVRLGSHLSLSLGVGLLLVGLALPLLPLWLSRAHPADVVRERLNVKFRGEATILALPASYPTLRSRGVRSESDLSPDDLEGVRAELGTRNYDHAVDVEGVPTRFDGADVTYSVSDYAVIRVLRAAGDRPLVLTVNAVLICPSERVLYLHSRSETSDSYGRKLHVIGGGLIPQRSERQVAPWDASLDAAMAREILEETGCSVHIPRGFRSLMWSVEDRTGFLQFDYLGLSATIRTLGQPLAEGLPLAVPFDDVAETLRVSKMVPSGRMMVAAWLGRGAPGCPGARFGGLPARRLFDRLVQDPAWPPADGDPPLLG